MALKPRGRPRKRDGLPTHIDSNQRPPGAYWDPSGNGYWYTKVKDQDTGKTRRKRLAGPTAKMSDLHKAMEQLTYSDVDTMVWAFDKFMASPQYKKLSDAQDRTYTYVKQVLMTQPTLVADRFVGQIPLGDWTPVVMQKLIDLIAVQRGPSAAAKVRDCVRRVWNWGNKRGYCLGDSPTKGLEMPEERQRRRLPEQQLLGRVIVFAHERGQLKSHTRGSCASYIWKALVMGYETRLRGVEVFSRTEAHELKEGLECGRTKGSATNIARWGHNLRTVVEAAKSERDAIWSKRKMPIPMRPEQRYLLVTEEGNRILANAWHSAWKRFMELCIAEGIIEEDQKFGLHDMKRRGTTDTKGTKQDKLDATGLSSLQILKVYDHSVSLVPSTSDSREKTN